MNSLPGDDGKVLERKINTDDVTGEMVDTKSRLEAKKQMRLKYLEFLKQSKNMEEVLQVQNEINGIQEQIESAASRVGFLSHQSAYSTINLSFYQPMTGYKPTDGAPSFLTRISTAFKNGTSWMGDLLVGLIAIWPLFLILFGFYIGWKMIRKPKVLAEKLNVVRIICKQDLKSGAVILSEILQYLIVLSIQFPFASGAGGFVPTTSGLR